MTIPSGFGVDCLSSDKEERLEEALLDDRTPCWVTRRSQRQRTPTMSQTMAPFADVEVEQDGHMDEKDVRFSILLGKEKEPVQGVEGVVAEQADDDGTGRKSTTTERLGTATGMTSD